jgi:CRP/FNR family transcriptional regulator
MNRSTLPTALAAAFPFWSKLGDSDRELLCENALPVRFSAGTRIHDGNECTGLLLIRTGCLRVYMLSEAGKEVTLYRLFAGEVCMLSASCVTDSITFDVHVDAEEDTECIRIGGATFAAVSERAPEAKIFALETTVSRFSGVMWTMQQILLLPFERRLAIFLLDELSRTGGDTVRLTHEQIARYMGSAREVVSRMLKKFAADGLVLASRKDGIRVLDKKRLRTLTLER